MNGVLHSEHVISRSGIAVSPREVKKRTSTPLALRSAGVAFLSTTNVGRKRCFLKRTPKSWRPDGFVGPECTPAIHSIQIFCEKVWREIFTNQTLM
jgi:hypothetical protein